MNPECCKCSNTCPEKVLDLCSNTSQKEVLECSNTWTNVVLAQALVTVRASQGGFGVFRNHGPRGLSGPAGGEENFEIALSFGAF